MNCSLLYYRLYISAYVLMKLFCYRMIRNGVYCFRTSSQTPPANRSHSSECLYQLLPTNKELEAGFLPYPAVLTISQDK